MEQAFITGNASKENILKDAKVLDLDMNLVNDFFEEGQEAEDADDDDEKLIVWSYEIIIYPAVFQELHPNLFPC